MIREEVEAEGNVNAIIIASLTERNGKARSSRFSHEQDSDSCT